MCNYVKHTDPVFSVAWFKNNLNFISISTDGKLSVWNIGG